MANKAPEWVSYAVCGGIGSAIVRYHLIEPLVSRLPKFDDSMFLNVFVTAFCLVYAENKFFKKLNFEVGAQKIVLYSALIFIGANIFGQYR